MNITTIPQKIISKVADSFNPNRFDLRDVYQGFNTSHGFLHISDDEGFDATFETKVEALTDGDTFIIGYVHVYDLCFWSKQGEEMEKLFTERELEEALCSKNFNS